MRNIFLELGYKKEDIDTRLEDIINRIFFGKDGEKIYYEAGEDMAYVMETG